MLASCSHRLDPPPSPDPQFSTVVDASDLDALSPSGEGIRLSPCDPAPPYRRRSCGVLFARQDFSASSTQAGGHADMPGTLTDADSSRASRIVLSAQRSTGSGWVWWFGLGCHGTQTGDSWSGSPRPAVVPCPQRVLPTNRLAVRFFGIGSSAEIGRQSDNTGNRPVGGEIAITVISISCRAAVSPREPIQVQVSFAASPRSDFPDL
jgi:hypothetical protein